MKKILMIFLLILFCLSCTKTRDRTTFISTSIRYYHINNVNTKVEETEIKDSLLWKIVDNGMNIDDSIIDNEILYTYTDSIDGKGSELVALNLKNGIEKWKFNSKADRITNRFIKDNKIIFGASTGILYAVDIDTGKEIWEYKTSSEIYDFIYLSNDSVICRDYFFNIYSVNIATGKENWRYIQNPALKDGYMLDIGPILNNGIIFFENANNSFIGLDAESGLVSWNIADIYKKYIGFKINDGKIFFLGNFSNNSETNLICIDLFTGKQEWSHNLLLDDANQDNTEILLSGNNVFVRYKNLELYSFNENSGEKLHIFDLRKFNIITEKDFRDNVSYNNCVNLRENIAYFLGINQDSISTLYVINTNTGDVVSKKEVGLYKGLVKEASNDKLFMIPGVGKLLVLDIFTLGEIYKINIGFSFNIEKATDDIAFISESLEYYFSKQPSNIYAIDVKEKESNYYNFIDTK